MGVWSFCTIPRQPWLAIIRSQGSEGRPERTYPILEVPRLSIDEQHVALPKLYGAPAYARPAAVVAVSPRPFDPDDMPIEAFQTREDREFAAKLSVRAWSPGGSILDSTQERDAPPADADPTLHPQPLSLRSIAGKLLGGD